MIASLEKSALDQVLTPVAHCFTPAVARKVASLRADPQFQARMDEFARKANEGELSEEEYSEYEAYVEAIDIISILQSKARRTLVDSNGG